MKETLLREAAKIKQKNYRHRRWQKAVSILACIVVFCTVYALILPAVTMENTPYCGKEEHTHNEDCYEEKLICGQEEGAGAHQHSEECYREEQVLVCPEEETDGHQHTDDCYTEEEVLTCTNTEEDHVHSEIDGCYTTERVLTCGKEEGEGAHHHTAECYETKKELICGQEEGEGAHHHTAECYQKELICGKEEHVHTLVCYSDSTADVEDESQWRNTFSDITLTGNWAKDLVAVAQTQTGYKESSRNYEVNADNTTNGYTRYGAWAGMPYSDWSAAFASFCLNYAGIPESAVARNTGCEGWNTVSKDGYTPKEGDLIILDGNQDGIPEHAGIVTSGSADSVTAIVGDSDKEVRKNTYSTGNAIIIGYVPMPENPDFSDGTEETTPTPTPLPEPTEEITPEVTEEPEVTETPEATPTEIPEITGEPEATPTEKPEITKKPLRAPKADEIKQDDSDIDDEDSMGINTPTSGETVDQRIRVNLSASTPDGKTGQTLSAKVVSTYSQANNPNSNATVCVKIGQLPEGIKIEGFTNGKHTVVYNDGKNSLELTLTEENGEYYITYEQPAGSTIEFDVQLSSTNGTMPSNTEVTLSVDKNRTQAPDGTTGTDFLDDSQKLTWTAKNEWYPVQKKVNGKDLDQTRVSGTHLSGNYEYTIQANSSNRENYGEIWTDYITVTDTFTLPENISFPEGTRIDQGKIVTASGETILSFTELQGGSVENLALNGKNVVYTLKIPNQNMKNGVPTMDQKHLDVKMLLDASKLNVPDGYKDLDETVIRTDLINNHVKIEPHPYKPYDVPASEDFADIMPSKDPEKIVVSKKADTASMTNGVKAGDKITYTLSVENTGTSTIVVKDAQNNYYKLTDTLPKYLTLTDAQISELENKGITVSKNKDVYVLSWIPSQFNMKPGEKKEISFEVTVKEADDPAMKELQENSDIINQAQYKSIYTEQVKIKYHKGYTTVEKESNATGILNNGDVVTYTITVTNPTNLPVANETIRDTLPSGLEFISAQFNKQDITESKSDIQIDENHKVNFNVNKNNLSWQVDKIGAGESLTFTYKCRVNTDQTGGATTLKNNVTTGTGGKGSTNIEVSEPISIDKTVDKDTNKVYSDGQIFNYTITLTNDQSNPNSVENQQLTDNLPAGMILLDEEASLKKKDNQGNEISVSWNDFYNNTNNIRDNGTFSATVAGRTAEVTFNQGIILNWLIDELGSGQSITMSYHTKLFLTEEQKKDGQSYPFTNTVKYLNRSKSVTVYGGSEKGKLYLQKSFDGVIPWSTTTEDGTLYLEKYANLTFTLTGTDANGNTIIFDNNQNEIVVRFSDFTGQKWNGWRLGYTFDNLPVGNYTIVETNADVAGSQRSTTYRVKIVDENGAEFDGQEQTSSNQASPEVFDFASSGKVSMVTVVNKYTDPKSIDLQKSVWGIYNEKAYLNDSPQKIVSKSIFSTGSKKVVGYTITVINTGEEPVAIYEIQDELPEGLTYKGMASGRAWSWAENYASSVQKDKISTQNDSFFETPTGFSFEANVQINAKQNGQNLTMTFYKNEPYKLGKKKFFSFFVVCEVSDSVADVPLTNTARVVVESETMHKDFAEIRTAGTINDAYQNNGSSRDEGVQNGRRMISSEVTITPVNKMIPGITKEAVSYIPLGESESDSKNITTNSNISPQSAVKWLVTLYNDGTEDMSNYKVTDVVTQPFHLITREEAQEHHITQAFVYEIYNAYNQQQYQEDITEKVWQSVGSNKLNEFEFDFSDVKYKIPVNGYAKLELYTENKDRTQYQIYTNTATLIPSQEFNANGVKPEHGELVKDDGLNEYIGVKASASVNALGEYGTVSWKTITEDGNTSNTASGSNDKNYITVEKNVDVIYSNNITNVSSKNMHNIVMIDLLPGLNDTGVVNQKDIRGSEFTVSFADRLNIYKLDQNNNQSSVGYTVKYSGKTSFTNEEFRGNLGSEWHEQWQSTDRSFVLIFDGEMKPWETLVCEYRGKLGNDAAPGLVAWNSFGYRYQVAGRTEGIIAEPPKVGVKIPASSPIIRKEVVDSQGKTQGADQNRKFRFKLMEGETEIATFEVAQGGYVDFKDLKDTDNKTVTLVNGTTYQITEVDIPSGYQLLGIGEEGKQLNANTYSFTYHEKKNLVILARNQMTDNGYTLPETGGTGTNRFTAVGLSLMAASLMCEYVMRRKRRERRGN